MGYSPLVSVLEGKNTTVNIHTITFIVRTSKKGSRCNSVWSTPTGMRWMLTHGGPSLEDDAWGKNRRLSESSLSEGASKVDGFRKKK